jgi:hypothetical protein
MKYWAYINNEIAGPYEKEELENLENITSETLVCPEKADKNGEYQWQAAHTIGIGNPPEKEPLMQPSQEPSEPLQEDDIPNNNADNNENKSEENTESEQTSQNDDYAQTLMDNQPVKEEISSDTEDNIFQSQPEPVEEISQQPLEDQKPISQEQPEEEMAKSDSTHENSEGITQLGGADLDFISSLQEPKNQETDFSSPSNDTSGFEDPFAAPESEKQFESSIPSDEISNKLDLILSEIATLKDEVNKIKSSARSHEKPGEEMMTSYPAKEETPQDEDIEHIPQSAEEIKQEEKEILQEDSPKPIQSADTYQMIDDQEEPQQQDSKDSSDMEPLIGEPDLSKEEPKKAEQVSSDKIQTVKQPSDKEDSENDFFSQESQFEQIHPASEGSMSQEQTVTIEEPTPIKVKKSISPIKILLILILAGALIYVLYSMGYLSKDSVNKVKSLVGMESPKAEEVPAPTSTPTAEENANQNPDINPAIVSAIKDYELAPGKKLEATINQTTNQEFLKDIEWRIKMLDADFYSVTVRVPPSAPNGWVISYRFDYDSKLNKLNPINGDAQTLVDNATGKSNTPTNNEPEPLGEGNIIKVEPS